MTFADVLEQHITDTYQLEPITHRCGHCEWTAEGQLEDTLPLFLAHMKQKHPTVEVRRRMRSEQPINQFLFDKQIEENMIAARAQGALSGQAAA